ncbi:hypothetical protein L210DRAFT_3431330, partial [Boletus edulis BED1]
MEGHQTAQSLANQIAEEYTLNEDQRRAFMIVTDHASTESCGNPPIRMFLGGPGGTGKSQVILAIRDFFVCSGQENRLRLTSYMGVAALNIGGNTLHSALLLGRGGTRSSQKRDNSDLMRLWDGVDYLLVDEISTVGAQFLENVNDALC